MPGLDEIKQRLAHLDKHSTFWGRRELQALPQVLLPDEIPIDGLTGVYNDRNAMVVATDRRVIFVDKGMMGGLKVEDFPYDKLSSVKYELHMVTGTVTLYTSGNAAQIKWITKTDVQRFADAVRAKLISNPQPAPQATLQASDGDMVSKLERLATLKGAGALSEEEFQQFKSKLLGT